MINNPYLTCLEQKWLSIIWDISFPYKKQMQRQIEVAKLSREYTPYYKFLNFDVPKNLPPLPHLYRVPIEVWVHHKDEDEYDETEKIIAPTEFLLHVIDGYVNQLEIYNADSSNMELNNICKGRREYKLNFKIYGQ